MNRFCLMKDMPIIAQLSSFRIAKVWDMMHFDGLKVRSPIGRVDALIVPKKWLLTYRRRGKWAYVATTGLKCTSTKQEYGNSGVDTTKCSAIIQPMGMRKDGTLGYFIFISYTLSDGTPKTDDYIDYDIQHELLHIVEQENNFQVGLLTGALEKHMGLRRN